MWQISMMIKNLSKSCHNMKKVPSSLLVYPRFNLSSGETWPQKLLSQSLAVPFHSTFPQGFLIFSIGKGSSYTPSYIGNKIRLCRHDLQLDQLSPISLQNFKAQSHSKQFRPFCQPHTSVWTKCQDCACTPWPDSYESVPQKKHEGVH